VNKLILAAAATLAITLGACTVEVKEPKAKETPTTTTTTQPAPPVAPAPVVDGNAVFCNAWFAFLPTPEDSPEEEVAITALVAAEAGVTDPAIRAGIVAVHDAITDEDSWNAFNAIDIACGGTGAGPYPGDNGPEV